MRDIKEKLQIIKDNNLFRNIKYLSKPQDKYTNIDGKDVLLMSSNNYLGLCNHEQVKKSAIDAINKYGLGTGGSRLTSGSYDLHKKLEEKLAIFKGYDAALIFNTGYMANLGVISSICDEDYYIFSDELNHASIIDGCRLSKGKIIIYKHNDMKDLLDKINKIDPKKGMIVTDSVFSMDGDIANVGKIVEIGIDKKLITLVDDAHATGVIGKTGRGSSEYFNCKPDILIGTLSKSIGSEGGFVCASYEVIEYLKNKARSFIFSTALSPAVINGSIASLDIIENNTNIVEKLEDNISYLRLGLKKIGFNVTCESPIIPIPIGQEEIALKFSERLLEEGIFIPAIRYPTVKRGEAILRMTLMATHDYEDIDFALDKISKIKSEFGL
ncbi:8-amino-7-oxononanoate synthase [Romboutsia weinsteinii]|uniref:8-amino-7-ketopelargonate synthase n=1 Tax=Romboutsia weinsteinii TaxID=2020949 RepID=A0A371IZA0_9FIRM|nr:8-amino-7-oxononanoate synthase [Romboutsia weinsteinii]RDY25807.1 8-amino-7-oxononanoate synthase [Romboutsia weinsteinii]